MTIPQVEAIRSKLGKNIALKIGVPNIFSGISDIPAPVPTGKRPKLSQFMAFANAFNGIK